MPISKEWTFQRDFLRRTYNKEVNEWFRDVDADHDNSSSRRAAKAACLIKPNESQLSALHKRLTFRFEVQQVHLRPHIYGIPVDQYQEDVSFRPQITFYFKQDAGAVPDGFQAVQGQFSIRLVNETSETISQSKANSFALEIKSKFALNKGYVWEKGALKVVCRDAKNGVNVSLMCRNESAGIEIIQKIYNIIDKTYDPNKVSTVEPKKTSVTSPVGKDLIYGKQVRERRWRPVANVRFQYAALSVDGLDKDIILVDRSKKYFSAIETA